MSPANTGPSELVDSRRQYLISSSEEKYGSSIHEDGFWKDRITDLTLASLKFEVLSRSPKQTVSLSTDGDGSDIKVGSFVLYNCSRLATLFKNYHEKVEQGVYPTLCSIDEATLSLLKTEDEWRLVLQYINVYPVMVSQLRRTLQDKTTDISNQLSQVVKFLHNLSRDFSTYYSRTHILGESRSHLMPTMMARLWLLKLVQQIFIDGLSLISITPYESM